MGLTWGLLSKPKTRKYATDELNDKLNCATCCMQGWRETQEDAHNCIIEYDANTSYFAVYDGHGGVEVSEYTSRKLPDFIKNLEEYKNGNIGKALEEAFLKFDATLVSDDVCCELQKRRNIEKRKNKRREMKHEERRLRRMMKEESQETDMHKVEEEDVSNLYEEATMPIEQVIQKYKSGKISCDLSTEVTKNDQPLNAPSCSSSAIHISETDVEDVSTSNCNRKSKMDTKDKSSNEEESQLNESIKNECSDSEIENKVMCDEQSELNESVKNESNDSKVEDKIGSADATVCTPSDFEHKKVQSNHDEVEPIQTCESSKPNVCISSTVPHENGEVLRKGKAKSKTKGIEELKERVKEVVKQELKRTVKDLYAKPELKKTAKDLYKSLLAEEWAEEESEEEDETFVASNDDSSDDGDDHEKDETADVDASFKSDDDHEEGEEIDVDNDENEDDDVEDEDNEDDEDDGDEDDEDDSDEDKDNSAYKDSDDDNEESFLDSKKPALDCGCTAVVAILKENTLYVANAGDSRCVVCRNGKAIAMSMDHKPWNKKERTRIEKAGGYICSEGRVEGGLNLSRALGDHNCKQNKDLPDREQMITALPDVKTLQINPEEDEFMIVACDGIWDSMSNQEAVDFVKSRLDDGREKLSSIFEEMFDHILAPDTYSKGCDNMTAILVQFKATNPHKRSSPESDESKSHKTMKTEHGKAPT